MPKKKRSIQETKKKILEALEEDKSMAKTISSLTGLCYVLTISTAGLNFIGDIFEDKKEK